MPNRKNRKSKENSNSGSITRSKLREAAKQLELANMSKENEKHSLSQVLSLINPFDIKKIPNIKFYLKEFHKFLDRTEIKDDFKLQILKAKLVGSL